MEEEINDTTYQEIKKYALLKMAKVKDENHNAKHVERVKNNALEIIKLLNIESEVNKNLLKTICLLHDFSYIVRKPSLYTYVFEGQIERKITRLILEKFALPESTRETIIKAVSRHAHSFPFRRLNKKSNVYTKVLQDADTLDFFNCLRIKMFMGNRDGFFRNIKRKLGSKLIGYGVNNLGSFLNYPILAKSFFLGSASKCV